MRGYELGPNLARLIKNYWKRQRIFPKVGNCLGTESKTGRGATQGDPAYPTIFNIMVDAVVQAVLDVVCGPQEAHHGLGWAAGERNVLL